MKPLLLFQSQLDPEPRSIREEVLGERQQALDVELISRGFAQLHFGECELLTQLIALPLTFSRYNRAIAIAVALKLGHLDSRWRIVHGQLHFTHLNDPDSLPACCRVQRVNIDARVLGVLAPLLLATA